MLKTLGWEEAGFQTKKGAPAVPALGGQHSPHLRLQSSDLMGGLALCPLSFQKLGAYVRMGKRVISLTFLTWLLGNLEGSELLET